MSGLQNRKTVVVLTILAAGLWGGILWRLILYTGKDKTVVPVFSPLSSVTPIVKDTLHLNYRDPFVEISPESSHPAVKPLQAFKPVRTFPLPEEPPSFRLSGIIRKGKKDFLLFEYPDGSVQGLEGGMIDGYTVVKIHTDSVVVRKAGRCYTLMLN